MKCKYMSYCPMTRDILVGNIYSSGVRSSLKELQEELCNYDDGQCFFKDTRYGYEDKIPLFKKITIGINTYLLKQMHRILSHKTTPLAKISAFVDASYESILKKMDRITEDNFQTEFTILHPVISEYKGCEIIGICSGQVADGTLKGTNLKLAVVNGGIPITRDGKIRLGYTCGIVAATDAFSEGNLTPFSVAAIFPCFYGKRRHLYLFTVTNITGKEIKFFGQSTQGPYRYADEAFEKFVEDSGNAEQAKNAVNLANMLQRELIESMGK